MATVVEVTGKGNTVIGMAGIGSRKDIRNAVEAASQAGSWSSTTITVLSALLSCERTSMHGA